jgi:hypothetical protein
MWLWRLMWAGGALAFAMVTTTIVLLLWFMIEVGLGWVSALVAVLVAWLLFSAIKNQRTGFDIRR